ncbi:MAG: hypothetical protein PF541_04260 [Prolixibacteraceae bacterium]|jgi:hypothetical protein|nr:hypothetical protein [Prolixibacteraceae bacterium]
MEIPACDEVLTPLLAVIPLQLYSYYVALARGCDVDQPRNKQKSVLPSLGGDAKGRGGNLSNANNTTITLQKSTHLT